MNRSALLLTALLLASCGRGCPPMGCQIIETTEKMIDLQNTMVPLAIGLVFVVFIVGLIVSAVLGALKR